MSSIFDWQDGGFFLAPRNPPYVGLSDTKTIHLFVKGRDSIFMFPVYFIIYRYSLKPLPMCLLCSILMSLLAHMKAYFYILGYLIEPMIRSFVFSQKSFEIGVILFHEKSFVYVEIKVVKLKVGHKSVKKKLLSSIYVQSKCMSFLHPCFRHVRCTST